MSSSENAGAFAHLSDALANAVATIAPSVVAIHARRRIPASGVVWRSGLVVATNHTIRRDDGIKVTLHDGRTVDASIVGRDAGTDLVLLKLSDEALTPVARGDETALRVGQLVLAVARVANNPSATLGTIHALGGEWRTWFGGHLARNIRVDIAIHDGFSGSPLVDATGRVVAINSSVLARGAPAAISASTVDRVVDELLKGGRVPRGWLGIGTQPVRIAERLREEHNLTQEAGLLITNVAAGSPAERANLYVGDTLIALAGTSTASAEDVQTILGSDTVGRTLTARLVRAGTIVEVPVEIGEAPHRTNSERESHIYEGMQERMQEFGERMRDMNWYAYAFGKGFGRGRARGDRHERHDRHDHRERHDQRDPRDRPDRHSDHHDRD